MVPPPRLSSSHRLDDRCDWAVTLEALRNNASEWIGAGNVPRRPRGDGDPLRKGARPLVGCSHGSCADKLNFSRIDAPGIGGGQT